MNDGKKLYDGFWFFPVYAYIHSGVALSLSRNGYPFTCGWNTSFKGFILVERVKGWSWKENQAYEIAESHIETWNIYLSGQIYGYYSEAGSCGGFYGDEGYKEMMAEAKGEIDGEIKYKREQHLKQVKTYIKNHVPLQVRKPIEANLI